MFGDRLLGVIAVVLLGITTVGTAWRGYQAVQWSGTQTEENRSEAQNRSAANREFGVSVQTINYDTAFLSRYAQAPKLCTPETRR